MASPFRLPARRVAIGALVLLAIAVIAAAGAGWYLSGMIKSGLLEPDYGADDLNLRVVRVQGNEIVLTEREGKSVDTLDDPARWGLEGESGYGQIGAITGVADGEVTREFTLHSGSIDADDYVRMDSFAYNGDPLSARGLPYREVVVPSEVGDLPAWKLDGTSDTWVIFVHGWRSDREEALRILPTVSALGLHSLVITYRNDEEAPRSEDGLIWWGLDEWRDVESAVEYATSQGARSVVLYGYSMGGGTCVRFLEESERAAVVKGVVLDSPVLDFETLVGFQAERMNVPGFLVSAGKQFATLRFGVDWDAMDHLAAIDRLNVPVLLFHGDNDDRAPVESSERLARLRSDIVTYVPVAGAGHVRPWNVDPSAYEARIREFLAGGMAR